MTKQPFIAEAEREEGFTHVLLITTGSVASVKAPLIVSELLLVRFFFPCRMLRRMVRFRSVQ